MKNLLYIIAGLLVTIWLIIFLSFNATTYVHLLLVSAAIVILIPPFMSGKKGQGQRSGMKPSDSFDNLS